MMVSYGLPSSSEDEITIRRDCPHATRQWREATLGEFAGAELHGCTLTSLPRKYLRRAMKATACEPVGRRCPCCLFTAETARGRSHG